MRHTYDIIIIGTGAGGGTLAYALRKSGARILLLERGDYLPQEPQNWNPRAVFDQKRYKPREIWEDAAGQPFQPGVHYFVGGSTKVFGAALQRLRREDFGVIKHEGGSHQHGQSAMMIWSLFMNRQRRSTRCMDNQVKTQLNLHVRVRFHFLLSHTSHISLIWLSGCISRDYIPMPCQWEWICTQMDAASAVRRCDGFPCQVLAKSDADVCCVRPTLESPTVELWTNAYARRLLTNPTGQRVAAVEVERDSQIFEVYAQTIVVSCGAVNSAALLLRSANERFPHGLGNSSDLVGRNYMVHNNTALMAVRPLQRNPVVFQKTLAVNDFYLCGPEWDYPMGNIQLIGKLQAGMLTAEQPFVPGPLLKEIANRSIDWWVMSEDLPERENRVVLAGNGSIRVHWRPNNLVAHKKLLEATRTMLRRAGYPIIFTQSMGIETNSHQCGTLCFGTDPASSVLDPGAACMTWRTCTLSMPLSSLHQRQQILRLLLQLRHCV